MPTECERSVTSPTTVQGNNSATELKENNLTGFNEHLTVDTSMMEGDMSTSQTSTTSNGSSTTCNGGRKTSITSPDPTAYVAKARVTRPTPPPPPYNPMQFVQIKPCNLYQTAQEQLKKAEEVKKIKEIRKEEPEDWQNNLDNWKSSRRKRVEHIIDRVVEVKKLELEEHDRTRRKSKTFSEMIEERGERSGGRGLNKLASLAVYAEDEANDLSDLGIGTSSASGKSSLSEDYDNNSVMSDNAAELDKAITNSNHHNKPAITESTTREYISSPGYETSSSTAPASSPDPCEYTYEGAIQDYKQRVSRAASGLTSVALNKLSSFNSQQQNSKESTPERPAIKETSAYPPRRGSKIEDRLMGFEVQSPSEECVEKNKVDVPKIDILKRKEIFESQDSQNFPAGASNANANVPRVTLRERFKVQETVEVLTEQPKKDLKRLSGDITSIKERLQSLEQQQNLVNGANGATKTTANKLVDIPVPPLKERLSSLQNAVTKEEIRKPPVKLVDARQLEIMKSEEEKAQQTLKEGKKAEMERIEEKQPEPKEKESKTEEIKAGDNEEIDKDDSGIHTADDIDIEERQQAVDIMKKEQELKLNAAIEALAKEEQQLSEAANAVNQIEAEFEELSLGSVTLPPLANNNTTTTTNNNSTPITNDHMEYSVSFTNPEQIESFSNNLSRSNQNISNNCNATIEHANKGEGNSSCPMVKGLDSKANTNLRRKPTNEMVHAKNLLKIFKETFQNDNELDEQEAQEASFEIKNIKDKEETQVDREQNIKTQIFETSKKDLSTPPHSPQTAHAHTPFTSSMIPRSITPLGKPPMSPLSIRSNTKFIAAHTPPGSPSLSRKADSQFSINGRVEIFNSKTMTTTSPNNANLGKPLTPTMNTKKSQLPYLTKTISKQTNNIGLPQQQLPQEVTTKQQQALTVIEPLLSTTTRKSQQQQQLDEEIVAMKSKPSSSSHQMAIEPQVNLNQKAAAANQQQPTNHDNNSEKVKQQQTEVVVCAPPITIVNPDELPKPNTVKNLSSCFQQQSKESNMQKKPVVPPKPLPRTFKTKQTPPPSPVLPRRHLYCAEDKVEDKTISLISCSSTSSSSSHDSVDRKQIEQQLTKEYLQDIPSAAKENKEDKKEISTLSAVTLNVTRNDIEPPGKQENSSAPPEDKKLSVISSTSTSSSSSTGSTVIDATKKLSIQSDISSTSEDSRPQEVTTTAWVHQQPAEKEANSQEDEPQKLLNFTKTLDQQATESLIEEIKRAETEARSLAQQNVKAKNNNNLAPLKIEKNTTNNVAKELFLQDSTSKINKQNSPSSIPLPTTPKPFTTPLQPLETPQTVQSPTKELFKTTTPLVVSTLYDKYQPGPNSPPLKLNTPLAALKAPKSNESSPSVLEPAELPALPDCASNESTLYKLASSVPHTPNSEKSLSLDADMCKSLLTSLAVTPEVLQRQHTVEEEMCQKVDKETLPFHEGATGFKDITKLDIKNSEGVKVVSAKPLKHNTQRQITVEEEKCQKIDVNTLPDDKDHQPKTVFQSVSPTEIRKCDNYFALGAEKPSNNKTDSRPNSPILQARAAHSRALIETCEKIIAEERLASSQLKSSLPPCSPQGTPLMQRLSKIPKPIASCCKATESLNEADLKASATQQEKPSAIARLHVVETQIKVTTTTPPASPKITPKTKASPQPVKKTKNIFDFLKKNFGVGGGSHSPSKQTETEEAASSASQFQETPTETPILVLSEEELKAMDQVKYDEVHTFDNSKFYVPAEDIIDESDMSLAPPPLPKTPAPVNIEITRKITTDEILEDGKTEKDLTKEIDDLLDDELNKLNHEIEQLEKVGCKQ